jgi:pimeloyl-ACP methyl ester carboxylesterase
MEHPTFYRAIQIDGLSIFYREAGPKDAPTLLLLHGLPSSSRMFEPLFARLSDHYHLIAPDYPGFGHSDWPDPKQFSYTFDHCAEIMTRFTEALGLSHYTLYMQDYGGPVGFRIALAHPERVEALIVQNAVAHNEGLGPLWKARRAFWADRAAHEDILRANLLSLQATRTRHVGSDPNVDRYDPDLWTDEFAFLSQLAKPTFKATCSTTTAPMSTLTPSGRTGCDGSNRACWWSGASMIPRSISRSRKPIAGMCRRPKSTFLTLATSHWTRPRMRSQH